MGSLQDVVLLSESVPPLLRIPAIAHFRSSGAMEVSITDSAGSQFQKSRISGLQLERDNEITDPPTEEHKAPAALH